MSEVYLLDTDVVSNFRKRRPHPNLVDWFNAVPPDSIAVSAMTIFEIKAGAHLVRGSDAAKADEIEAWLNGVVLAGRFSILPLDTNVARVYAAMFVTPSLKTFLLPEPSSKRPKSGADLIIAATAIVHRATVVSTNMKDFLRINNVFTLPSLYEPFSGTWVVRGVSDTPPAAMT